MIIKCWGARGSIPVSGRDYLKYGGDTTCIEIRTKDDNIIIIDTGSGIRELGKKVFEEKRDRFSILFTHFHWDHIMGFPFFRPINNEGTSIDFYGCAFDQGSIEEMISKTMVSPHFPVNFNEVKAKFSYVTVCSTSFHIGSVAVTPIMLSHPNKGLGYKFVEDGKVFLFITDNELTYKHPGGLDFEDYREFCSNADLLMHDSEYVEEEYEAKRTWGHSIYNDALRLAMESGVKSFGLYHHNQNRTDDAQDAIVGECQRIIAEKKSALNCFAVYQGMVIAL
ncbi:MBL fold metallo-hydrolase [Candidatus Magnetominusculus xianensis]|uniref:Metal-dependent hydrolase n=1 Tax=Candidatus Magnetominusculus xianensis TaxID=1748249 RepID=A0ABR5SEW3_9BACT|nr:MBL fold metallo-hydrolase [Candidatus Magnetominusculus xianensis]KWT83452.1 metal-dependent hydrolase [Candidatus Magnetominusculus xianensis]MBF0405096.1 MBL fold metallo-hydrolase [Nitrospirota bacterium]